ncbi:MAG: hypothetical protein SVT56_06430 [Chloroflexota bacterium]|nr:hypothetical protein [Chloroflexota bacterium]
MTDEKKPTPQTEPSVWDYVVSKIQFWKKEEEVNQTHKLETSEGISCNLPVFGGSSFMASFCSLIIPSEVSNLCV